MPIHVTFACSGCDAEAEPLRIRQAEFVYVSRDWGAFKSPLLTDLTPEGWQFPDRYTGLVYCPECWAEIESDTDQQEGTDG